MLLVIVVKRNIKRITSVLDVMSYYNLNVMIFHVRILNDALYTTTICLLQNTGK